MRTNGFSSKTRFAKILGEKLEEKKILHIDIVDGKFKKFPGKKSKTNKIVKEKVLFFLFQGVPFLHVR